MTMTESSNKLTKKDITKLAVRTVFLQSSFNYEKNAGWWLVICYASIL